MTTEAADKAPKRGPGRPKGSKNRTGPEPDLETAAAAGAAAGAEQASSSGAEPPPADTPPGAGEGSTPRRRRVSKKVTKQIEDALAEVLQAPAMPCAIFGDEWAADHFEQAGAVLANKIAVVSERNAVLRGWCERAMEGESIGILFLALLAYAGPPLIHWNLVPVPGLRKIPRRPRRGRPDPETMSPTAATEWQEQAPPETVGFDEPVAAEFFGGDNGEGPPTFSEVPPR